MHRLSQADSADSSITPVFIIGVPRSGTTLLRVLLDSHSRIAAAPETPWLAGGYGINSLREIATYLTEDQLGPVKNLSGADEATILQGIRALVKTIFGPYLERRGKQVLVLKTPDDIRYIDFLLKLYPDAQYIHIFRDGRDVACSTVAQKGSLLGDDILDYGEISYETAMRRWYDWEKKVRSIFDGTGFSCIRISYEDLVMYPEETLRKVCEGVGVKFEEAMIQYNRCEHEYPEWEAGSTDAKQKTCIDTGSIGRWKKQLDKESLLKLEALSGELLETLGYELSTSREERLRLPCDNAMKASGLLIPTREINVTGWQDVNRLYRLVAERNEQLRQVQERLGGQIAQMNDLLSQREDMIRLKSEQLDQKDTQIAQMNDLLNQREDMIRLKSNQLDEKDAQIAQKDALLERKESELSAQSIELRRKAEEIVEGKKGLEKMSQLLQMKEEETRRLIDENEAERARLQSEIADLLNSMSWKITGPLRTVYGMLLRQKK